MWWDAAAPPCRHPGPRSAKPCRAIRGPAQESDESAPLLSSWEKESRAGRGETRPSLLSSPRTAHGEAVSRDPGPSARIRRVSVAALFFAEGLRCCASLTLDAGSRDAATPHAVRHDDYGVRVSTAFPAARPLPSANPAHAGAHPRHLRGQLDEAQFASWVKQASPIARPTHVGGVSGKSRRRVAISALRMDPQLKFGIQCAVGFTPSGQHPTRF
jgi:hypothetical protein